MASTCVNTVVCSADPRRLEALVSGTLPLPKQTKPGRARVSATRVRPRAHMRGERAAAKWQCVSAKTNRLNEKQLPGQRARKGASGRWSGPGQAKHTDPAVSPT